MGNVVLNRRAIFTSPNISWYPDQMLKSASRVELNMATTLTAKNANPCPDAVPISLYFQVKKQSPWKTEGFRMD